MNNNPKLITSQILFLQLIESFLWVISTTHFNLKSNDIHQFYLINFDLTCATDALREDPEEIPTGYKATFIIDVGFIDLANNKIAIYTAS